jgi:hypothetical protein
MARATPLGLLPLRPRGCTGAATGYRRRAGGVVAADPPPLYHLVGGQVPFPDKFVVPIGARPRTETWWRQQRGSTDAPRSRALTARASCQGLVLREVIRNLPLQLPRHNLHLIQRRSATAGGTCGDFAVHGRSHTRMVIRALR